MGYEVKKRWMTRRKGILAAMKKSSLLVKRQFDQISSQQTRTSVRASRFFDWTDLKDPIGR